MFNCYTVNHLHPQYFNVLALAYTYLNILTYILIIKFCRIIWVLYKLLIEKLKLNVWYFIKFLCVCALILDLKLYLLKYCVYYRFCWFCKIFMLFFKDFVSQKVFIIWLVTSLESEISYVDECQKINQSQYLQYNVKPVLCAIKNSQPYKDLIVKALIKITIEYCSFYFFLI